MEITTEVCVGETAIDVDKAKRLLGWRETEGKEFLLKDHHGNKVVCDNNLTNRPLSKGNYDGLVQEHLRGKWRLNGEPIIVGDNGAILNGQHSLIALILASQILEDGSGHASEFRESTLSFSEDTPDNTLTMDKVIVYGIEEDDEIVNTMDTCKPRTLTDVVYRSDFSKGFNKADRKRFSRVLEFAVRHLWSRTGKGGIESYFIKRTHSESVEFINNHPTIIEFCQTIYELEEGKEKRVSRYIPMGTAASILFLMATSSSSQGDYDGSESSLSWDNKESAIEFWQYLANPKSRKMLGFRKCVEMMNSEGDNSSSSKVSLISNAWELFVDGEKMSAERMYLDYEEDDFGVMRVVGDYPIGGIDLGNCQGIRLPDMEEIESIKEQIRKENDENMRD